MAGRQGAEVPQRQRPEGAHQGPDPLQPLLGGHAVSRLATAGTDVYARILNPTLPADDNDNGLYLNNNYLDWYDDDDFAGTVGTVKPGKYIEVAFTRNTDGKIRVYANGEPDIKHADADAQAVIQNHLLRFFVDNSNDETSKGAVSRIRLYNDALTAKKVKRIYQQGHCRNLPTWSRSPRMPTVRVAAVQAMPVVLDLQASLDKALGLLADAAGQGAQLVVFPETFLSLYPSYAWAHLTGGDGDALWERLWASSVEVPGPVVDRIAAACRAPTSSALWASTNASSSAPAASTTRCCW